MFSFRRQTETEASAASGDAKAFVMVLSGGIDEFAAPVLDALKRVIAGNETVRLDLAGVTHVNSIGVLAWSAFIADATASATVELSNCSVDFIDMANLTPMLTEGAGVVSFHVPTRCAKCRDEAQVLVRTQEIAGTGIPLAPCKRCGGATEAIVETTRYLEFLDVI
jgi:ABC-type transporter Mla MlaB component